MSSAANEIVGLYERHAGAYDEARGKSLFEVPWLDRFLGVLPLKPAILDIGCGSGEPIARYFIERDCELARCVRDHAPKSAPRLALAKALPNALAKPSRSCGESWEATVTLCPRETRFRPSSP